MYFINGTSKNEYKCFKYLTKIFVFCKICLSALSMFPISFLYLINPGATNGHTIDTKN